jgi:DNA-directed RNA polymerase specialized sigma subunit
MLGAMADVTQILAGFEAGDPRAAAELMPLVYGELRKLAAARLSRERPGQTIQATALDRLEVASPRRARLVKLRYFAGFTLPEVAQMLGISQSRAEADWTYAKAWLKREMGKG